MNRRQCLCICLSAYGTAQSPLHLQVRNLAGRWPTTGAETPRIDSLIFVVNFSSFNTYHILELKYVTSSVILANCKDFEAILTDGASLELCDEISVMCSLLEKDLPPLEVLKLMTKMNFVPNLSIALRILLILQISVASVEHSFSKLEISKNYLRTTTYQTSLSDLAILGIEYEQLVQKVL
ncbi:hypothetical protein AVEN_22698-1 [Araneus ventricosus]|uniref:HAT C-terminal dimerisation domain-containing protein n=1 Tax=Araneus ventricosus TaxID=182803 RepID=A0A4Y2PE40_ARAVE|nr:hypothetical protein AVEN_13939-1 [Araneus ventricosus]GBN48760.1 hypothetical protein AVEN_129277-1 [Araneus ventricosus]GBN52846.1 hypothetical protein AVEN_157133-1 [Araneus ventricosus]GBN52871.1 hypothetical protein AVEN_22698-1 [Araneus ventricosus]